jgi:hypothetical protein
MKRHMNDRDRDNNPRNRSVGFEQPRTSRNDERSGQRDRPNPYLSQYGDRFVDPYERDLHPKAASGNYAGKGPKGFHRSDDRVREEVCATLTRHPGVDATDIDVDVSLGVVTLKGTVQERRMKHLAEISIENLLGVKDVINQVRVRRADDYRTSSEIARAENPGENDRRH